MVVLKSTRHTIRSQGGREQMPMLSKLELDGFKSIKKLEGPEFGPLSVLISAKNDWVTRLESLINRSLST